jgi:hypothetical protein
LPDEAGGFVRFTISPKPDLPKGTVIKNAAELYIGYQKPELSNETYHTIGDSLGGFLEKQIITSTPKLFAAGVAVQVEPNPFTEAAFFNVESLDDFENFTISVYDQTGRLLRQIQHTGNRIPLERGNLTAGLYFYKIEADGRLLNTGKLIAQ